MKILITGANGQLGQEVVKVFEKGWDVISTDTDSLDITDREQVNKIVSGEKPDWIIHCAAWTNVDAAAGNPELVMKVNGGGTKNICEGARKIGAKVVYISTNEVFDGKKQTPYAEGDKPNPINPYGQSKLNGEIYCQEILESQCIIVRSSWLYGPASENNFPRKILKKAAEQGFLKVVDDEFATPTYTPDLAVAIKKVVEENLKGIFHLINEGKASRYDWAREILREKNISISIKPMKLKDFQRASAPPENSVLTNLQAKKLGIILPNWRQSNKKYLGKI